MINDPRRIVVRLPNWLGDGVMAVPALRALRRRYPVAELVLYGRGVFEPLLSEAQLFDRFLPLAREASDRIAGLRDLDADLAIILPHSFRSAFEPWRAGIPTLIGYAREGRTRLLTHSIPAHRRGRAVVPIAMHSQYLELVGVCGASGTPAEGDLSVGEETQRRADAWLAERGIDPLSRPLGLNPGASFGPSKVYPPELLADAADRAVAAGHGPLVLLCGPGEEDLAREVASSITSEVATAADDPPPLDVLKGILLRLGALITTDSGPRHLATALGVPCVVVMGPTDPRFTAARLERSAVLRKDVPCGPCHEKVCPLDHRCMREIAPAEVAGALDRLLEVVSRR